MPPSKFDDLVSQILESIKILNDLTTRLDERGKITTEQISELREEVDKLLNLININKDRIANIERTEQTIIQIQRTVVEGAKEILEIEKRLIKLETTSTQSENRWQKISGFVIQIIYAVVTCYILWKFGLNNVSTPP